MKSVFPDLKILPEIFKNYPDIQAVYLFGSVADGKENSQSDIDLAIQPRNPSLREKKLDILADLTRHGFNNVDVVFLDIRDIVVRFEAIRRNRLVYSTPDFDSGSFFSLTIRQYFDFLPFLQMQREAYKQRILSHGH
ncbi:MAG: nucleotidyltransferase domain-containing protein [Chloroflexi bacterium]|nr:nucleotidyltransferase domain-containing protein [Chloroflexota bacterium]